MTAERIPNQEETHFLTVEEVLRIILKNDKDASYYADVLKEMSKKTRGNFIPLLLPEGVKDKGKITGLIMKLSFESPDSGLIFGISPRRFIIKERKGECIVVQRLKAPQEGVSSPGQYLFTDGRSNISVTFSQATTEPLKGFVLSREFAKK